MNWGSYKWHLQNWTAGSCSPLKWAGKEWWQSGIATFQATRQDSDPPPCDDPLWWLPTDQRANRAWASSPWSHHAHPEIPPQMFSSQFSNMLPCCHSLSSSKCRHAHVATHSTAFCTAQFLSPPQSWCFCCIMIHTFIWPWGGTDPSCCLWLYQCQEGGKQLLTQHTYGVMSSFSIFFQAYTHIRLFFSSTVTTQNILRTFQDYTLTWWGDFCAPKV